MNRRNLRDFFARRRQPVLPLDADLAAGCDRLRDAIREAQQPGSDAWLEELWHSGTANRRNTRKIR